MPEVEEVFRLATNKVKPDPNALERQQRRQRSAVRSSRARAYVAVAAVLLILVAGALVFLSAEGENKNISVDNGESVPSELTFTTSVSEGGVKQRLEVVDLRGRTAREIPGLSLDGFATSLSADGSTIAFVAAPAELGYNQIGIMSADGSEPHFISTPGIIAGPVALSPDATRIAFEGLHDANIDIYVVDVDGSALVKLTDDPATDQYPQWSPNGNTIAYDNAGANETQDPQFSSTAEIWTVPADGSGAPTRLTHDRVDDSAPSFSPDGSQIVYFHAGEIRTMSRGGSDQRMLLAGWKGGFTPRWSPQGDKIAFTVYNDSYRPLVQLGDTFSDWPLVTVAVLDVDTGQVTKLEKVGMATDLNTPQWVDDDHLLLPRVPVQPPPS
jgi:TolB protein